MAWQSIWRQNGGGGNNGAALAWRNKHQMAIMAWQQRIGINGVMAAYGVMA